MFPSTLGGGGWGGISHDPDLGYLFTNVNNLGQWGHMEKRLDARTGKETYVRTSAYGTYARFWNRDTRIPCSKPPFGELVAVEYENRRHSLAHAIGDDPRSRSSGREEHRHSELGRQHSHCRRARLHRRPPTIAGSAPLIRRPGRLLWEQPIDANGHTIPITYLGKDGKQYVVIMASGGGGFFGGTPSDSLMAFALGESKVVTPPTAVSRAELPKAQAGRPVTLPDGPEKVVLRRACGTTCHNLESVTGIRRDRPAWTAMIDNMVARGAKATPTEINMIVDYLSTHAAK